MKKAILLTILFIFSIVISIALYTATIKGVPGNPAPTDFKGNLDQQTKPLELSPERGRYAQVISLIEGHRFDLGQTLADAVYPDVGFNEGRFYAYFAPGISILAAPFYAVGKLVNLAQVVTFSYSSIMAILTGFMIYLISRRVIKLPIWASIFASLTYMFGSTSWAYAVTLYQHQTTAFLILSAFYASWYFRNEKKFSFLAAFWVWLAAAIAILIDYPNALFLAPVMIYFSLSAIKVIEFRNKPQIIFRPIIIVAAVIFVAIGGFHLYYNKSNFGSPFRLSGSLPGYKTIVENNLDINNPEIDSELKKVSSEKNPVSFFSEEKFPFGIYTLFASSDRGLFLYSPIFLLTIFGVLVTIKKLDPEKITLLATAGTIIFLYSSWGDPWGGWAFGPRYLIPALPIFVIFIALLLSKVRNLFLRFITFILFGISSAISIIGVLTTNAIPPKVEADYLHTGYNFLQNWKVLMNNSSSSYVYNTYLSSKLTLSQYGLIIFAVVNTLAIITLFIIPLIYED